MDLEQQAQRDEILERHAEDAQDAAAARRFEEARRAGDSGVEHPVEHANRIAVDFDDEMLARIDAAARLHHLDRAGVVKHALAAYIDQMTVQEMIDVETERERAIEIAQKAKR